MGRLSLAAKGQACGKALAKLQCQAIEKICHTKVLPEGNTGPISIRYGPCRANCVLRKM